MKFFTRELVTLFTNTNFFESCIPNTCSKRRIPRRICSVNSEVALVWLTMRFKPRTQSLLASLALSAFCLTLAATAKAAPCDPVCATISEQGKAVAPANAPVQVKKMIAAGNRIHRKPYVYGGGHSSFNSSGYDCSGTVSYLLRAAGALDTPLDSSSLMNIGSSGSSRWVSVYSNPGHAFIVVAGLRFDTSYITDGDASGPGWSQSMRPTSGYAVRHIKIAEAPGSDNVGGVATKETGEEQSDLVNGPPRPGGIKPIANLLISNSGGFGTGYIP